MLKRRKKKGVKPHSQSVRSCSFLMYSYMLCDKIELHRKAGGFVRNGISFCNL